MREQYKDKILAAVVHNFRNTLHSDLQGASKLERELIHKGAFTIEQCLMKRCVLERKTVVYREKNYKK